MREKGFGEKLSILTFDIEEWFHILDVDSLEIINSWDNYEARIYENTYRILDVLKLNKLEATFFVLGWIVEKYPGLIRDISNQGHEIGTHSLNHPLVYKLTPKEFRNDLKKSIDIISTVTNRKVRAFRAPGFSIKKETFWAFEVLAEEGIEIDSSIFPAARGHGGIKDFGLYNPFKIKIGDKIIKEFPINMHRIVRFKIPFSGGGYFRAIPYPVITYFADRSDYLMTYFHPRDFDPNQPIMRDLPLVRKFKSYYGLKKSFEKFKKIIKQYNFIDISAAERIINWNKVPLITIQEVSK